MHPLMVRVLEQRQLNSTGQLFQISDYDVITDLHTAFSRIKGILDRSGYAENRVDRSVVEIVIARILAAIRETHSMETYSPELVDVLECCLRHPMSSLAASSTDYVDSPHCRIASDLLSSLFYHYANKSVMTIALPAAIKALQSDNKELVKSVSSYISLSAIHNGKALAQYSIQIIGNVINGNYSLLRVLPQIYADNREPVHAHLPQLMRVLHDGPAREAKAVNGWGSDCSEPLSILQLASMLANHKPDLLLPYLPLLSTYLIAPSTSTAVLHIFLSLVSQSRISALAPYLPLVCDAAGKPAFESNRATFAKVIGVVGRTSSQCASTALDRLTRMAEKADKELLPMVLHEIEGIGEAYPSLLAPHVPALLSLGSSGKLIRVLERITTLAVCEERPGEEVTVISVGGQQNHTSRESLASRRSHAPSMARGQPGPIAESVERSALELDKNTHTLAMSYQNRSSGSLSNTRSRSFVNIDPAQSRASCADTLTIAGSRDLSASSVSGVDGSHLALTRPPPVYQPKTNSLPANFHTPNVQIGRDGRVRPIAGGRRAQPWQPYETTFPVNGGPVTTTKVAAIPEVEEPKQWPEENGRGDVVRQFVDNRRAKISRYVETTLGRCPIPIQCTVEGSKTSKHRMRVHFQCSLRSPHCVFTDDSLFAFKTKHAPTWLHLMFLQMEAMSLASSGEVVSQASTSYSTLAHCWDCLPHAMTKSRPFATLVTSAFPSEKEHDRLLKELSECAYFDCFQLDPHANRWTCFSCAQPERVKTFVEERVLEGQLKEKRGRWKFLRRWHTKYFTLSTASLAYGAEGRDNDNSALALIDLKSIRSVKSLSRGRRSRKSLRRAFEIFTADNMSYVLKATDEKKAEEWMQCLQYAVAQARKE